jgi:hypothetical protein
MEAGRAGADEIAPEHLLLGVLTVDQDEPGRKTIELQEAIDRRGPQLTELPQPVPLFFTGETAVKLRQAVTDITPSGEPVPDSADMHLAPDAKWVLDTLTDAFTYPRVDLPHVLRGLLDDKESFVGHLLEENGITVEQIDAAIRGS